VSPVLRFQVNNISTYYTKRIRIIDIGRRVTEQLLVASSLLPGLLFVADRLAHWLLAKAG